MQPSCSESPLWDPGCRDRVSLERLSDHELNRHRSETFLVPGTVPGHLEREEARVPVLLVQRPSSSSFGSGWDLITPAGWGEH